jgi:hypothetical protein
MEWDVPYAHSLLARHSHGNARFTGFALRILGDPHQTTCKATPLAYNRRFDGGSFGEFSLRGDSTRDRQPTI